MENMLAKLLIEYPNHRLIFIYPHSEHDYTLGTIHSIQRDEYYEDDYRFYLYGDIDDLVEFYADDIADEKAREKAENAGWEECIVVYITS